MILAGHQPNYLPYLGFFHKLALCDLFVLVDNVQFVKRGPFGWINRNKIRTPEGEQWLTVPVLVKGKFLQKIMETKINTELPWGRKHWRSLLTNYGKAPHFSRYADFFEETLTRKRWENFSELSEFIILRLMEFFKIHKPVKKSSQLGAEGKGDDLILDLCRRAGADTYLHGKHGRDYADEEKFQRAGIKSLHQEFEHPVYHQRFSPFIPNLSAVDLLFNHGEESLEILLGHKKISKGV